MQAKIHRPDRSAPVKVLALQGDYHKNKKSEIFPFLQSYCSKSNITFRHGAYTGSGWEVQEYSSALATATADPTNLLRLSMVCIQRALPSWRSSTLNARAVFSDHYG